MINILIPLSGSNSFFQESNYLYSKPIVEINGKPMIEYVVNNLIKINEKQHFIFIVNKKDCMKFHLDNTLKLLTNNQCDIIKIEKETQGAACSCLMAIEKINNKGELIISNGDQVIDVDFNKVLRNFHENNYDGGVIVFESVHPKWSYVRLGEKNRIVETAEKRPLSKDAIAGFYYYKQGQLFVDSAMNMIRKDASVNGIYYISPTFNELVLQNKNLGVYRIESSQYHNFYSPQRVEEYERLMKHE